MPTKLLYMKESWGRDLLAQLRSGSHLGPITCGQKLALVLTGLLGYRQQKAWRAASEGRDNAEQTSPPSFEQRNMAWSDLHFGLMCRHSR